MSGSVLARRYVQPLFEVAKEKEQLDRIGQDLADLDELLAASPELKGFLSDPSVERADKRGVLDQIFAEASPYTRNYLRLVVDKNRTDILRQTNRLFKELVAADKGVNSGVVESAAPLKDDQLANIKAVLEKRFKTKLALEPRIVPELIGGLRIQVGNTLIDDSIRNRLNNLRRVLAGEIG